jgi:8-oxo-dGTP pyrophosphatase MutT (NUDIX family)
MNTVATLGQSDSSIQYTDRPTVKVIIKNNDLLLVLNKGLLPGGGLDGNETDQDAINRELQEELGVTVKDIIEIDTVIQYRNFLRKRYIINGYVATLASTGAVTNPQDVGEAAFTENWLSITDALEFVSKSIAEASLEPMIDDAHQGKLYNLMTTYELLKQYHSTVSKELL